MPRCASREASAEKEGGTLAVIRSILGTLRGYTLGGRGSRLIAEGMTRSGALATFGLLTGVWLFACSTRAETPQPANLLNLVEVTIEADSIQIPSTLTAGQLTFSFHNATDGDRTAAIEGEGHR